MRIFLMLLMAMLALNLTACGNKGRLKSPKQIELEKSKKAKAEARKNHHQPDDDSDEAQEPTAAQPVPQPPLPGQVSEPFSPTSMSGNH
jgi:predicted small lipoprotein YifL